MRKNNKSEILGIDDYIPYAGETAVKRIRKKAVDLKNLFIAHYNSTFYGGGVAEMLSPLTLLLNDLGIKTEWRTIQGTPDFFNITKKFHNALQGDKINLSKLKKEIYEKVIHENAVRNRSDHDFIIVHDPQPLPLIKFFQKKQPWIWRCHLDLSEPNIELLEYLKKFIEEYDVTILTLKEYKQDLDLPQVFFKPGIDPICIKNRELSKEEIKDRLEYYDIQDDLPLIVQVSRFDHSKDPEGVIKAFKIVRDNIDCNLVLLGNIATDDPEGEKIYNKLLEYKDNNIRILSVQDSALVNALQRTATVVVQKSLKEGFGLTVTEAMWKGAAVVGGNVGGIKSQIEDGYNGFLVSSIEETAEKVIKLIEDDRLSALVGKRAKETVKKNYLMTNCVEKYLDLFNSFETFYRVNIPDI
jgi:trehalose synthase